MKILRSRHLRSLANKSCTQHITCIGRDSIGLTTNRGQIRTDAPQTNSKNYSPQSHRGHREKLRNVDYATGAVNKVQ